MENRESDSKNMLSVQQVAERLGISSDQVRSLILNGKLRASDLGNARQHHFRVKPEWVEDFIVDSEVKPPKPRVKQSGNLKPSKFANVRSFS